MFLLDKWQFMKVYIFEKERMIFWMATRFCAMAYRRQDRFPTIVLKKKEEFLNKNLSRTIERSSNDRFGKDPEHQLPSARNRPVLNTKPALIRYSAGLKALGLYSDQYTAGGMDSRKIPNNIM